MPRFMIDPPSGWQYGFPKAYDRVTDGDDFMAWLVREGYPQREIDRLGKHFYVRQWYDADPDSDRAGLLTWEHQAGYDCFECVETTCGDWQYHC